MAVALEPHPAICEMFPPDFWVGDVIESIFHPPMPKSKSNIDQESQSHEENSETRKSPFISFLEPILAELQNYMSNHMESQSKKKAEGTDEKNSQTNDERPVLSFLEQFLPELQQYMPNHINPKKEPQCKEKEQDTQGENPETRKERPFMNLLEPFLAELQHQLFNHKNSNSVSSSAQNQPLDSVSVPIQTKRKKEKDSVTFDMGMCDPNTIKIKLEDNIIKVTGKKESHEDGVMVMSFERTLPKGISSESLSASLSQTGILTLGNLGEEERPLTINQSEDNHNSDTLDKLD